MYDPEIITLLKAVAKAVQNISPIDKYAVSEKDTGNETAYYGFIAADGSFYIMKDTPVQSRYYISAAGETLDDVWPNRATLIYKPFNQIQW